MMNSTEQDVPRPTGVYVDPGFQAHLDAADAADELTISGLRADMEREAGDMRPATCSVTWRTVTIPASHGTIPARIYHVDPDRRRPLVIFLHGGGWVSGTLAFHDPVLRRLARDADVSILTVDYRLAPEHPFPAGLEDACEAAAWADRNRETLGVDERPLVLMGDSAGGNLAAAAAQRLRDVNGPTIAHQLLIYPVVSRSFDTDTYREYGTDFGLTTAAMEYFWERYTASPTDRPRYADLTAVGALAGLPSATVITCALDPLCDEGESYAHALASAGVPVTFTKVYGMIHGAWTKDAVSLRAYQLGEEIALAVRRAVGPDR